MGAISWQEAHELQRKGATVGVQVDAAGRYVSPYGAYDVTPSGPVLTKDAGPGGADWDSVYAAGAAMLAHQTAQQRVWCPNHHSYDCACYSTPAARELLDALGG